MKVECVPIRAGQGSEGIEFVPGKEREFRGIVTSGTERVHMGDVFYAAVEAETYVWIGGEERLEEREWDFTEFQREKMRFWVGEEGDEEYAGELMSSL